MIGQGVGFIPVSEIKAYIELFDLEDDARLIFDLVRTLDSHYIVTVKKINEEKEGG